MAKKTIHSQKTALVENKIGYSLSISTECKNKAEGRHNSISAYRNSSNLANLKIANSPTER